MKVQWRYCKEAEREHEQSERQYAHTYHHANTICVCRAFWDLPKDFRDGILLHEIGHLLVGPEGSEMEATRAAEEFFDVPIHYVDSPYGRELERVSNMARRRRRRNPEEELPFNEWIPAHAVMFNEDGTVSVMAEQGEALPNGRRRNAADLQDTVELAHVLGRQRGEIDRLRREPMPPPWPQEMMPELRRLSFPDHDPDREWPMLHPDVVDAYKEGYHKGRRGMNRGRSRNETGRGEQFYGGRALRDRLEHAVTEYDRKQSTRAGYNPYALAQYLAAVDDAMDEIGQGTPVTTALEDTFNRPLLTAVLRAAEG